MEMGIDVMAVPGSMHSPMSAGTNRLIAQGAIPITHIQDVLVRFNIVDEEREVYATTYNKTQKAIIDALHVSTLDFEDLQRQVGLSTEELSATLTELELLGTISILPGNYIKYRG